MGQQIMLVARSSQNFSSLDNRLAIVQATPYGVNDSFGVHGMTFPLLISSSTTSFADSRGVGLPRPLPVQLGGSPAFIRLQMDCELRVSRFLRHLHHWPKNDHDCCASNRRHESKQTVSKLFSPKSSRVLLAQPDLDSPVIFATLPRVVGSDWQRLPVSSH